MTMSVENPQRATSHSVGDTPKLSAAAREGEARPAALITRRVTGWGQAGAGDIDPIVVGRLIDGEPTSCTAWERRAAVVELRRRRWSQSRIADQLAMPERQVVRDLDRAGMTDAGSLTETRNRARRRRILVAELYRAGARVCEIATLLEVHRTVASRDLTALGLPSRQTPWSPCAPRVALLERFSHVVAVGAA